MASPVAASGSLKQVSPSLSRATSPLPQQSQSPRGFTASSLSKAPLIDDPLKGIIPIRRDDDSDVESEGEEVELTVEQYRDKFKAAKEEIERYENENDEEREHALEFIADEFDINIEILRITLNS